MRTLRIIGLCIVFVLGAASSPVNADNTVVVVVTPTAPPDYSYLHDAGKQAFESVGTALGQMLYNVANPKQVVGLRVVIKCNHYDVIEVTYRDGSIKVMDDPRAARGASVDREQLNTLANTLPGFIWRELGCDE